MAAWAAARTMAAFAVIAGPWVIVLSLHYGRPVFSTSGAVAHAIAGPKDMERDHPVAVGWYRPPESRNGPGEQPSLRFWSPFESLAYARHQAYLIRANFRLAYAALAQFDLLGIGLIVLVGAFLFHKPWRANMRSHPWRWAATPVACLLAWYLPVYFEGEARYCWPAYPFMLGAALGMAEWLTADVARRGRLIRAAALAVVVLSFAAPAGKRTVVALGGQRNAAYDCAKDLRKRLDAAGLPGPIASVGRGERVGLYLGFLRDEPWYGSHIDPTPQDFDSVRARLYVVGRHSPLRERLEAEGTLENLDGHLFSSPAEAAACPVAVYGAR